MLQIKALQFFGINSEPANPRQSHNPAGAVLTPARAAKTSKLDWPEIDRRNQANRRLHDRRAQQHAILLNTRKIQGRRKTLGRRKDDHTNAQHAPISIKG